MNAMTGGPVPGYEAATALIVVDVQNDFADPGGSLYVPGGESVVEPVNEQIAAARAGGATIVFTQDWHPPESPHFESGGGRWPPHCVRRTWGADLHPGLDTDADLILRKGTRGEDGYSAFTLLDPLTGASTQTGLAPYLLERGISTVVVVGLAADVCVLATVTDAAALGFEVVVPLPATKPIGAGEAVSEAIDSMRDAGVQVVGAIG
jgi:nicotinamidase/pyrazinamidase